MGIHHENSTPKAACVECGNDSCKAIKDNAQMCCLCASVPSDEICEECGRYLAEEEAFEFFLSYRKWKI